jgi:hypothetical protein
MPADAPHVDDQDQITFEAFGVPIALEVGSPHLLSRVWAILPPARRPCSSAPENHRFRLSTSDGVSYRVELPGQSLAGSSDLDVALGILDAQLRAFIAMRAPEHIFVHAGVAALHDRAVVIPGPAFSGKTTLVAELVRAGALYYSDDLAALDCDGLVHPYPKLLSIRSNGFSQIDHEVTTLGGSAGTVAIPVGLIILSQYRPGARWEPHELSAGDAMLALLSNTVPAHERPEETFAALTNAVDGALVLEGERGEAAEVVEQLLQTAFVDRGDDIPNGSWASIGPLDSSPGEP